MAIEMNETETPNKVAKMFKRFKINQEKIRVEKEPQCINIA